MTRDTRRMLALTLLLVPTIIFGGTTLLGVISGGAYGTPGPASLTPAQVTFYRAGHAHAGVLTLLALILQPLVDHARIARRLVWPVRLAGPLAALLVSGGFFATAHAAGGRWLLYLGALTLVFATVSIGVGLLLDASRNDRTH